MIVAVRLFARAKDLAGSDVVCVELPEPATVAQLRLELAQKCPSLAGLLDRSAIAVHGEIGEPTTGLVETDEIAVLPPVSGGSW